MRRLETLVRCPHCNAAAGSACTTSAGKKSSTYHVDRREQFVHQYGKEYIMRVRFFDVREARDYSLGGIQDGDVLVVGPSPGYPAYRRIICRESDGAGPPELGDGDGDISISLIHPIALIAKVDQ